MLINKQIIFESISLAKFSKRYQQVYFNDFNFSLSQNDILSIVNKNNDIQQKIYNTLTFKADSVNDYQGLLFYNDLTIKQNCPNLQCYLDDLNFGFNEDLTNNKFYKKRLREYLEYKFDTLYSNKKTLEKKFKTEHSKILKEYKKDLEVAFLNTYLEYIENENKNLKEFLNKTNSLNTLNTIDNFDLFLDYVNISLTKSINHIQYAEENCVKSYLNCKDLISKNILFLNRDKIIDLENEIFKNKLDDEELNLHLNNYISLKKEIKNLTTKNNKIINKTINDIYLKQSYYKHKFKFSTQKIENNFYLNKYNSLKFLSSFLKTNKSNIIWLKDEEIKNFLREIQKFINQFENISIFDSKQKNKKIHNKLVKQTTVNQIHSLFGEIKTLGINNKKIFLTNKRELLRNYKNYKTTFNNKAKSAKYYNDFDNSQKISLLREMKLDYEWNLEQTTKKYWINIKKLRFNIDAQSQEFIQNVKIAKDILNKIEFTLNEIILMNKHLKNSLILNGLSRKYHYIQKQQKHLSLYQNNFSKVMGIIKNKNINKDTEKTFLFKEFIYDFLEKYDLSKRIIERRISNISEDILINLELFLLFYREPKIIIVNNFISKLNTVQKKYVLSTINKYVLNNKISAIYFLDDLNLACEYSMETIVFDNNQIIEKGNTNLIFKNPIHPVTKELLRQNVDQNYLNDYYLHSNNFVSKQYYKIDKNHVILCSWNNLINWTSPKKVKNNKLSNLLFNNQRNSKNSVNFIDHYDLDETIIANFSTKEHEEQQKNMEKNFNHKLVEKNRYDKWLETKVFENHNINKRPFTIILPPPNVTGILHVGHALDTYIQDTIIRFKKLQGYDTLFLPAKDHAGIATQSKVEKLLQEQGISKHALGREKFIEEVWKWKDKHSHLINEQWKKLGLSLDYSRERFTLDDRANKAVLKVFVTLYNKGLIYRGIKPIYWDPIQKTALSNIEVINQEVKQKMYYIKYPFKDNENEYLEIATTRIETLFSDVAVAFNPNDNRYQKYLNNTLIHPLTKKEIPIICDEYIDMSFGSGLMKVSAHAIEDINIIEKNNLKINECINDDGILNELAGEFKGLDRIEAREKISKKLKNDNYLIKEEEVISSVGTSERSGAVVEILVKAQWFLKMQEMSKLLLENLESENAVEFIPSRFKEVIKTWMEKAYDWTISRQLWWGHRIPAYYKDNKMIVSLENPGDDWTQDPDVLDTWFSSGLSPFVFLGWPEETEDFKRYFPTQVLVTGYDIIFFWVARMYFMSLEFNNKIPFEQVLLHGLVRDAQGRKLSKSLGNGIDPIKVIDEYGSDVLRISLLFNLTSGQDIHFSDQKLESSKLFVNKFWNIARYVNTLKLDNNEMKNDSYDIWILNKLEEFENNLIASMNKYDFSVSYKYIQKFIVSEFSAWYLEFAKFKQNNHLIHMIFKKILLLMHPFLPFTTDYLYENMYNQNILEIEDFKIKYSSHNEKTEKIIELITELRKYRETKNISKSKTLYFSTTLDKLNKNDKLIIEKLSNFQYKDNNDTLIQCSSFTINILLDQETKNLEIARLKKLIEQNDIDLQFVLNMLNNPKFMEKAKPEKVAEIKSKLEIFEARNKSYTDEIKKMQN